MSCPGTKQVRLEWNRTPPKGNLGTLCRVFDVFPSGLASDLREHWAGRKDVIAVPVGDRDEAVGGVLLDAQGRRPSVRASPWSGSGPGRFTLHRGLDPFQGLTHTLAQHRREGLLPAEVGIGEVQ